MLQDPNNVAQSTEEDVAAPETAESGNGGGSETTEGGITEETK